MASALLKGGFAPNAGLDRSSVVELWHVWNITGWSVDNTEDVVFSQTRAEGASHPDLGDAICKNRVLKDRWASPGDTAPDGEQYWQAIVAGPWMIFFADHCSGVSSTGFPSGCPLSVAGLILGVKAPRVRMAL